jgi:predicted MPP superfamily phosphohydrolase
MITRRQFVGWLGTLGVVSLAAAAYGVLIEPLWERKVARYQLRPRRWPPGLNLTIAAIADVHACRPWMTPERIRSIVAQTNALNPDLIVLLGDYVAGHRFVTGKVGPDEWSQAFGAERATRRSRDPRQS